MRFFALRTNGTITEDQRRPRLIVCCPCSIPHWRLTRGRSWKEDYLIIGLGKLHIEFCW